MWLALHENQRLLENFKKQIALREWQQKGGPKKLTLPLRSTEIYDQHMLEMRNLKRKYNWKFWF